MLTVTITIRDEQLSADVEREAATLKVSPAELIERTFEAAMRDRGNAFDESLPPITRKLAGSLPYMSDDEVERFLNERRQRKYGA